MLTPTEREAINDEVEQGTFDLENALDDIATEQKGEGVRRAIYGGIMLANKNGAGGTDLHARNRIADANGRIDAIESEMAQFIASHTGVVEGTRIIEDVLWTGNLYNSNDVAGLYAEIQGYDIRTYDYLDLYIKHAGKELIYRVTPNALISDGIQLSATNLTNDTWTTELPLYASEYNLKATMFADTWYSVEVDISVWEWSGKSAEASNQFANTSPTRAVTKIVGIKHQAVDASKDSELTDMRVGEDGTTYASAGQALRAQIAQLKQGDEIDQLKSNLQQDVYNFINYPSEQVTDEGITFTPKADEIVVSGTATGGDAWFRLYNKAEFSFGIENGKQYYIAVNQDDSEEYGLYLKIHYYDSSGSHLIASMNNGYFMFPYDAIGYALTLVVPQGVTLNNITVRPIMCELGNIKKILDNATKDIKRNLYTNLRYQTVTSNGITFTTNGNSIVLNGTSGNDYPIFVLCDSHYSLLYGLIAGKSYWFDIGLKDKAKVNYIYINLSFYLSDGTHTTEVGIKGPTKITVPINAVGLYMILRTQRAGLVIADNIIVSPGIYTVNPMAESRILEQAVSASENVISINGNYASYKDFNLYGVFLNRVTGTDELNPTWRSGYIPIPFAGKYQIFQTYGMFGNTYLNVPLYDKNKRFIKSITGVDSASQNIIEVTISESDLYDDMVYYIGLSYEPSASPDGIPMFMYNVDYPSDQRFIEPKYSVYKPYQPPMISIIDDDGASDFLTKLLPIIESKNIPIASAVVTSFADNEQDGFMTWDEIVDANNRGAEFVSHSDTHLFSPTSIEDAQMNYMRSFNKLRAHGVINDRNILVYAGASASKRNALVGARQIADGAIISSGNSMNYRGDIDPWMIKRYRIDADYQYNLDSMKELIDDCKSNGGWMIWMIHCSASEWDEYNAGTSFPQAIDYAIQNGVQIATINHAFKTYVD